MDVKSANKLAVTALNSELYAAFGKAWDDAKGNLAAAALSTRTSYEMAGARAYLFNIVPADDPRLPKMVAAYGARLKDPDFPGRFDASASLPPQGKPSWNDVISDARTVFASLRNDGKMNRQYLGRSYYNASGIGHVLDRDDIFDVSPAIRTRLMKEIAPSLENIALAAANSGDRSMSTRLLSLTAAAVTCGNDHQLAMETSRTVDRRAQLER